MFVVRPRNSGFTIVELLVVIVVIGILAALVVVSYTGINNKAIISSIQSDLSTAARQFKLYSIDHASYPTGNTASLVETPSGSHTYCPTTPATDTKYCLKLSGDNTIDSYTGTSTSFALVINNGTKHWRITENSSPGEVAPLTAIAAITGTTAEGSTLTAGATDPVGAATTATYQWQSADTSGGSYSNISGATSNTYTLVAGDIGKYIKVSATGTDTYTGSATSAASSVVTPPTVTIGTQVWMQYNLNVGTMLASGSAMPASNGTVEKWCYDNSSSNCTTYGGLYSWDEMMQYSTTPGVQGICPSGFHIPTDAEWKTLEMYLGMTQSAADATGWRGTDQGTKLKSDGSSGFNGLLAGYRNTNGLFYVLSTYGNLWTSSETSSTYAYRRYLTSSSATVYRDGSIKGYGYSVRCLKN